MHSNSNNNNHCILISNNGKLISPMNNNNNQCILIIIPVSHSTFINNSNNININNNNNNNNDYINDTQRGLSQSHSKKIISTIPITNPFQTTIKSDSFKDRKLKTMVNIKTNIINSTKNNHQNHHNQHNENKSGFTCCYCSKQFTRKWNMKQVYNK